MSTAREERQAMLGYFAAAFAVSWGATIVAATATQQAAAFAAMLLGPTLASLVLTAAFDGVHGLRDLAQRLLRWRGGAVALLFAPLLLLAVSGMLMTVSPAFVPRIADPGAGGAGAVVVVALAVGLLAGLFEEIGWTGFATARLLRRRPWLEAGLLLGVPWALWHALPDFIQRGDHFGALWLPHFLEWVVALTAYRVLMTWLYHRTGSVLLAVLMHAVFTGSQWMLWPPNAGPEAELLWYGTYAVVLAGAVMVVVARTGALARISATPAEKARVLPGDAIVPSPFFEVTHAITVDAAPERVWPWLAQLGATRAGWYSWDWIDNGGTPSADRIIEDLGEVHEGDVMPAIPGATDAFVVASVDPPHDLVLIVPSAEGAVVSWEHVLERIAPDRTRVIVRGRAANIWKEAARHAGSAARRPIFIERVYRVIGRLPESWLRAVAGAGHRWMEARHLRGIKRRAETRA